MATVAVGSSATYTANIRGATLTVSTNGGTCATVSGAASASIGPAPTRRTFGPLEIGQSITVAVLSGDSAIIEYGDADPSSFGAYDPSSVSGGGIPTTAKLLQMLALTGAIGTVYYVSASGNDNADGLTTATAWATVAKVNASNFAPGDAVLFEGGRTFAGTTLTPASGGSPTGSLYISSYGTGKATISTPSGRGAYLLNKRYITLDNLIFDGGVSATNAYDGVFVENTVGGTRKPGVKMFGLEVTGYGHCGIQCYGSHATVANGFSGLTIDGCYVHDCLANCNDYEAGIACWGLYGQATYGYSSIGTTIRNTRVTNCTGKTGKVIQGHGIYIADDCNALIEYCESSYNGLYGDGNVGIWLADCINSTIQFCESHHNKTSTTKDGDGIDLDDGCVNCTVQYCYSHDNDGTGILVYQPTRSGTFSNSNSTVRYNICANNSQRAATTVKGEIVIGSGDTGLVSGLRVHNNTCYASVSGGAAFTVYGSNTTGTYLTANVHNNLFYIYGAAAWNVLTAGNPNGVVIAGNAYWAPANAVKFSYNGSSYTTCAAWRTATSQETISAAAAYTNVDPLISGIATALTTSGYKPGLMGQFKTAVGSPLRAAAKDLATLYNIDMGQFDYYGAGLPALAASRDIGAYQA